MGTVSSIASSGGKAHGYGRPRLVHRGHGGGSQPGKQPQSVLILDDQSTGRKILEGIVQALDDKIRIASFSDPNEALQQIRRSPPDLILTDYRMPQMNGIEFIKRVRNISSC